VTRLRSSSASRHTRPEPGIRRRLASRPLLPTTAFARCGSTLRTSSNAVSGEAGASKRPFPPPQRFFLYGTPTPGSSFLACLFSTAPYRPRARSVACSPPHDPFSGSQGGSTPATRCPRHLSGAPNGSSSLAPPRDFRSLRLNARPDSPFGKLASAQHPISVHSPSAEALRQPPTDQRSRFGRSLGPAVQRLSFGGSRRNGTARVARPC
jgi:hypothetical protein